MRQTLPAAGRHGLSSQEAAERLARDGPNRLPPPRRPHPLRRLADQLVHFFALMLWVAGALAFVADLPELGVAIFVVVVLNALFAFAQETRADRAAERLRELLPRRVTVRRDGRRVEVDAADVVTGDLLALGQGDRVPADAVVATAHGLLIDTSLLTGESEAAAADRGDEVLAGMFVVEGEADAVVTATGGATRLADIARLTTLTAKPATPLARELHRVVRTVATIAVGVGGAFFGLALLLGNDPTDGFVFAIGVTVALVPEALLLDRPPVGGRLLSGRVARRAFGLLGPIEAASAMAAFVVTFVALGWRPGEAFPGGDTAAAASGAAFLTVVVAQSANAFACRSATRPPGALGWTTNRLLIAAVAIEAGVSLAMLLIGPVARELGHASPPLVGWLVACAAAGALLAGDALDKRRRRARAPTTPGVVAGAGRTA